MDTYRVNICGYKEDLPLVEIAEGLRVAFFNLHGKPDLTEHAARCLSEHLGDADIILTAESKGLQLAHCVARNLGHSAYAVARKNLKQYMKDGLFVTVKSITTENAQTLFLSREDALLMKNKRVALVDDVISTGKSLEALEYLVTQSGGTVHKKAFVLAEGEAANRTDILYLAKIPLFRA